MFAGHDPRDDVSTAERLGVDENQESVPVHEQTARDGETLPITSDDVQRLGRSRQTKRRHPRLVGLKSKIDADFLFVSLRVPFLRVKLLYMLFLIVVRRFLPSKF